MQSGSKVLGCSSKRREGGERAAFVRLGINDVINNNQALGLKAALTGAMQQQRNEPDRREQWAKESRSTEHAVVQSWDWGVKEEEASCAKSGVYWTREQERLFLAFWMEKVAADPLKMYSFDNPLKRSHYFQELSRFLAAHLGASLAKGDQQCKSKFATIRRKIQREKARGRKPARYGFIDYIIEEGSKMAEVPALRALLARLHRMRETDSDFMALTKKILDMERRDATKLKNNSIYAYLLELEVLPPALHLDKP